MYCFGSTCGWTGDSASDCNSQFDRWKGNHCLRKTGPEFACTSTNSGSNDDDGTKATCDSFSCDSLSNRGSGVSCTGDVNSCDATLCCVSKATCNSFSCSSSSSFNRGSEVSCTGDANSCDDSTCCVVCSIEGCNKCTSDGKGCHAWECSEGYYQYCSEDLKNDLRITQSTECTEKCYSCDGNDLTLQPLLNQQKDLIDRGESICSGYDEEIAGTFTMEDSGAKGCRQNRCFKKPGGGTTLQSSSCDSNEMMDFSMCSNSEAEAMVECVQTQGEKLNQMDEDGFDGSKWCSIIQEIATCLPSCWCEYENYGRCWEEQIATQAARVEDGCNVPKCGFAPSTIEEVSSNLKMLCLLVVMLNIF